MATIIKGKNRLKPWTVRYVVPEHGPTCKTPCFKVSHQKELSFRTRREADDFKADFEFKSREQTFIDPRIASEKFRNVADGWMQRHTGTDRTKKTYRAMLNNHVLPTMGDRRLSDVANDREGLQTFLLVTMPNKGQGASQVRQAYMVINAIVNDAIKSGKLARSRIRGLPLPASPRTKADDFVFPSKVQINELGAYMGSYESAVFLMRGCGLRISEALGVRGSDFRDGGTVLRLSRQRAPDGKSDIPLKHRKAGEFRDVPVPAYVALRVNVPQWAYVSAQDVPLFAYGYASSARGFSERFAKARTAAGIDPKFTPHSLRHVFASVCLAQGVPLTNVAAWLGHRGVQTTYGIYGHLVPNSWEQAREALDGEWAA